MMSPTTHVPDAMNLSGQIQAFRRRRLRLALLVLTWVLVGLAIVGGPWLWSWNSARPLGAGVIDGRVHVLYLRRGHLAIGLGQDPHGLPAVRD